MKRDPRPCALRRSGAGERDLSRNPLPAGVPSPVAGFALRFANAAPQSGLFLFSDSVPDLGYRLQCRGVQLDRRNPAAPVSVSRKPGPHDGHRRMEPRRPWRPRCFLARFPGLREELHSLRCVYCRPHHRRHTEHRRPGRECHVQHCVGQLFRRAGSPAHPGARVRTCGKYRPQRTSSDRDQLSIVAIALQKRSEHYRQNANAQRHAAHHHRRCAGRFLWNLRGLGHAVLGSAVDAGKIRPGRIQTGRSRRALD